MTNFTKDLYKDFYIYEVMANRRVNSRADKRGKVSEALITNFPMRLEDWPPTNGRAVSPAMASGELESMLAKQWLLENKYEDVVALIDEVMDEWKTEGKHTRRNWWEILAGDAKGNPRVVAGRKFPVLRAAQLRQGVPVTPNAICRDPNEEVPAVRVTGRWQKSS